VMAKRAARGWPVSESRRHGLVPGGIRAGNRAGSNYGMGRMAADRHDAAGRPSHAPAGAIRAIQARPRQYCQCGSGRSRRVDRGRGLRVESTRRVLDAAPNLNLNPPRAGPSGV
jgi:hypothetical protein